MSGEMKNNLEGKSREDGAERCSEHTRVLPDLKEGDFVQVQNLRGRNPLKSYYNGIVVGRRNLNSYAVKIIGTDRITVRNRVCSQFLFISWKVCRSQFLVVQVLCQQRAGTWRGTRQDLHAL